MDASGDSTVAQKDNGTVTQEKGLLQKAAETISHLTEVMSGRENDDGERLDNDDDRRREKFQPNEQTDRRNQLVDASDPNKAVVRSVTGTVKWFSIYDHYGFINRADTGEDVFVHVSALIQKGRLRYALEVDQEVEFDVAFGIKGPKAVSVSLPNGYPIEGGRYLRFNRRRPEVGDSGGGGRRRGRSTSQPNGRGQQSGGETTDNDQPQQRNRPQQQQRRQGRPRRERKRMGSRRANRQRRRSTAQSQGGDDGSSSEKQQQSAAEKQQQPPQVKEIVKETVVIKEGTQEKKQAGNAPHQKQAGDAPQQKKKDGDAPRQTQSDADTSASDPKQPMEA